MCHENTAQISHGAYEKYVVTPLGAVFEKPKVDIFSFVVRLNPITFCYDVNFFMTCMFAKTICFFYGIVGTIISAAGQGDRSPRKSATYEMAFLYNTILEYLSTSVKIIWVGLYRFGGLISDIVRGELFNRVRRTNPHIGKRCFYTLEILKVKSSAEKRTEQVQKFQTTNIETNMGPHCVNKQHGV